MPAPSAPEAPLSAAQVLARMILLLAAWALAWALAPQALLGAAWASFAWWTAMKLAVWFGLGAALFAPDGRHAWFGSYRGRIAVVALLAALWVGLDVAAVHEGLKPRAEAPTAEALLQNWNAWLNVLVVAPVLEELLFRGLFWSALERTGMRAILVWTLSAAAFAALHLPGWIALQATALPQQLALVFVAGLFCSAGRWLTGSVWPAVALHLVNNLASVGVCYG